MAALIDMVGSIILGAALLIIILNANDNATENHYVYNGNTLVQEMLISTSQFVEGEFRNMGLGVIPGQKTILSADTNSIAFLTDLNRDGITIDTISYFLGDTTELASTQNNKDMYLHRIVNHGANTKVGVVTVFKLRYISRNGEVLPTPVPADRLTEVFVVEVTVEVQNPYAVSRRAGEDAPGQRSALYSSSIWQQTRLASQNSRR
jgi:hypothetical protein